MTIDWFVEVPVVPIRRYLNEKYLPGNHEKAHKIADKHKQRDQNHCKENIQPEARVERLEESPGIEGFLLESDKTEAGFQISN